MTSRERNPRHRWTAAAAVALTITTSSCSGSDPPASTATSAPPTTAEPSTTAPERPASTTTTAFDPASVEGEVEAAYLRSWDVYADAVYNLQLDESRFAAVYGGEALNTVLEEIRRRTSESRPSRVDVDHHYVVTMVDEQHAVVADAFVNHQVALDPKTRQPIEDDPNEVVFINFRMSSVEGRWRVVRLERVES